MVCNGTQSIEISEKKSIIASDIRDADGVATKLVKAIDNKAPN